MSLLSICLFFLCYSFFFSHFNYFKLGHVGGSRGNSESDQWGASPSRSHQSVLKVRAPSCTGRVYVGPHPKPENSGTQMWLSSVSLPLKHQTFKIFIDDGHFTDVLKVLYEYLTG